MTRICSIPGCGRKHYARGLCERCRKRLERHGDPTVVRMVIHQGTPEERFLAKLNKAGAVPEHRPDLGPCWEWTAARSSPLPYGVFWDGQRLVYAHQYALQLAGVEVPAGREPDHLCRVYWCARPDHLEVVTHSVNTWRSRPWNVPLLGRGGLLRDADQNPVAQGAGGLERP